MYNIIQLVRIEHFKLLHSRLFWILVSILLAFNALFIGTVWFDKTDSKEALLWPQGLDEGLQIVSAFGPMLIVILVGATVGQAYAWRTTQQSLARGTSRGHLITARFLSYWLPTLFGFLLFPVAIPIINTMIFTLVNGAAVVPGDAEWGALALGAIVTFIYMLAFAAITLLIGVATRSTVAAVSGGIAILFIVENILPYIAIQLGPWAEIAAQYRPSNLHTALLDRALSSHDVSALLPAGNALVGLLGYIVVGVGVSYLLLRQQDLGG